MSAPSTVAPTFDDERINDAVDSVLHVLRPLSGAECRHVILRAMRWWLESAPSEEL